MVKNDFFFIFDPRETCQPREEQDHRRLATLQDHLRQTAPGGMPDPDRASPRIPAGQARNARYPNPCSKLRP